MRRLTLALAVALIAVLGLLPAAPASADHTDPNRRQSITEGVVSEGLTRGIGTWRHLRHFAPNPGSDLEFFTRGKDVYAATGTLGQGEVQHVGQRIIRVLRDGVVAPLWVADHGSAHCRTQNTGALSLQHDPQVASKDGMLLLTDTTDTTGRCHDPGGGGLELVDISGIGKQGYEPREVGLTRHDGTSHTNTVDHLRPWIVYNNPSTFGNAPFIDVVDVRSCFGKPGESIQAKRDRCRPLVYRLRWNPDWSKLRRWHDGSLQPGTDANCHDITSYGNRLYCAGLHATLIFDVRNLVDENGNVRGTPMNCPVVPGTNTTAMVTDCSNPSNIVNLEEGVAWDFLGTFNHPGRDCTPPPTYSGNCNSNLFVPADEGVSVSHEADPTPGRTHMFVTDERGGGVVPPGASCTPGIDNPLGNGGIHAFDIRNPANIQYAFTPEGRKAVFRSEPVVPAATFCDVHVIEHVPGEQRLVAAYYSQGVKIVDYFVDQNQRFVWKEVASFTLPGANTWTAETFKVVNNPNGTRTYYILATDIQRGIDVYSWTGPPANQAAAAALAGSSSGAGLTDLGLLAGGIVLVPGAALYGRRRRSRN